ncbi:MAG: HAD family hydrolase [Nocardioidaceae bacterium]|nr:HAD family hydrolase [Nocardioidaceae bacterium]
MNGPVRLAVWSGPRNISTALMRSWENRPDTLVVDEPLYAAYLARTGIDHPGRADVLAAGETDLERAAAALTAPLPGDVRVHYQKHMCHHLPDGPVPEWVDALTTVLLIRDPGEVVASYVRSRAAVGPADIGVHRQLDLLDRQLATGATPPVIDAGDFLRDPAGYLEWWCDWLGVAFTERMLRWPPGPRVSDGVWAPHWYAAVLASTGFEPWRPRQVDLAPPVAAVVDVCRPAYERLHARRVMPSTVR